MPIKRTIERLRATRKRELEELERYNNLTKNDFTCSDVSLDTVVDYSHPHASAPDLAAAENGLDRYVNAAHGHNPSQESRITGYVKAINDYINMGSSRRRRPHFLDVPPGYSDCCQQQAADSDSCQAIHQYFIPPHEVNRNRQPLQVKEVPPEVAPRTTVVEKSRHEVNRTNWFSRLFRGTTDLLVIDTVRVKVQIEHAEHYKGLTFKQLGAIPHSKTTRKVIIYNDDHSCRLFGRKR